MISTCPGPTSRDGNHTRLICGPSSCPDAGTSSPRNAPGWRRPAFANSSPDRPGRRFRRHGFASNDAGGGRLGRFAHGALSGHAAYGVPWHVRPPGGAGVRAMLPLGRPGAAHPVRITIDAGHPGPVVPGDFAGLSFERGPLVNRDAGVSGNVFSPANSSLV